MTLLRSDMPTVLDIAKSSTCSGQFVESAEVLAETNRWLAYVPVYPSNEPMTHLLGVETSKPTAKATGFNEGVAASKGTDIEIREPIGYFSSRSSVDRRLKDTRGDAFFKQYLNREDRRHISAVGEQLANAFIYGNLNLDPKAFNGLAKRFADPTKGIVLDAGGRGADDNLMVFIAVVGEDGLHGITPQNSGSNGIDVQDMGDKFMELDKNGNPYPAKGTLFGQYMGLALEDPRCCGMIANIKQSDWLNATGTQAPTANTNLLDLITRVKARLMPQSGKVVAFVPQPIFEGMAIQAGRRSTNVLKIEDAYLQFSGGRQLDFKEMTWLDVPLVQMDVMNNPGAYVPNIPTI